MPPAIAGYEAEQAADGTWSVFEVPLFGEHLYTWTDPKTGKVHSFHVDRAWLEKCVENHRRRYESNGYLPPGHLGHHPDDDPRAELPNLGLIHPKAVREGRIDGETKALLYGDLTGIPADRYAEIRAGKVPYLSVEALLGQGLIRSCAYLTSNAPRFPFPPIRIAAEKRSNKNPLTAPEEVLAFSLTGIGARAITRLAPMPTIPEPVESQPTPAPVAPVAPPVVKAADVPATPAAVPAPKPDANATPTDGEKAPTWATRMLEVLDGIATAVASLGTAVSNLMGKALKPKDDGSPADVDGKLAAYSDEIATLRGELAALKGSVDADKTERLIRERAVAAVGELQAAKYALPSDLEADLVKTGTTLGVPAMEKQIETIRTTGRKAPAARLEDVGAAHDEVLPPEVMKYAADTDQMGRALALSREFDALVGMNLHKRNGREWTRERYIEVGLARPALTVKRATAAA